MAAKGFSRAAKVAIMASSMRKSIDFYSKVLGFKVMCDYGEWAELKGPGITIGLYPSKRSHKQEDSVSIGFDVPDLGKACAALARKGVKFEFCEEEYVKFAYFKDPDGTELYLAQKRK